MTLDWPAVLRAVSRAMPASVDHAITICVACDAIADEIERQEREAQEPTPMQPAACKHGKQPGDPLCLACQPIPEPEVERVATLCAQAYQAAVEAWLEIPDEGRPLPPAAFWAAVARAVIADRVAHALALVAALTAERDDARRELQRTTTDCDNAVASARRERDAARTRAVSAEAERDALQRRLTDLAEVADERDYALREIARLRARFDAVSTAQQPPALSPADTLSGAEEMLRRIAASACLDLDATEAAAIVAELDRLRAKAGE